MTLWDSQNSAAKLHAEALGFETDYDDSTGNWWIIGTPSEVCPVCGASLVDIDSLDSLDDWELWKACLKCDLVWRAE